MSCARKERAGGALLWRPVLDDGLGDGGDVVVIESGVEGRTAMTAGAECDALGGVCRVGMQRVEGSHEPRQVDESVGRGMVTGGVRLRIGLRVGLGRHGKKHKTFAVGGGTPKRAASRQARLPFRHRSPKTGSTEPSLERIAPASPAATVRNVEQ